MNQSPAKGSEFTKGVTKGLRALLALVSLALAGWQVCKFVELLADVKAKTSVGLIPYNSAVQKAVELLVSQAGSWAQVTTIVLGTLGALWIAKGDEPRLALSRRLWPEVIMWCAGVLMLCLGLYCYNEYLSNVASALEAGGTTSKSSLTIANVFDERYEKLLAEQFQLLIFGTILSVVAILSVRHSFGGHHAQD